MKFCTTGLGCYYVIGACAPMVSVLFGWMLLGESINLRFAFGAVLIIGGALFSIVGKKN